MSPHLLSNIAITSVFTGQRWEGSLDLELGNDANTEQKLDRLFRLFNRVTDEDAERLEKIGFRQPSMSVGDVVEVDGQRYEVAPIGFKRV